jgi:hypothetical protein
MNWNFVSIDRSKLERARKLWQERGSPTIPGYNEESVPLP